VSWNYRFAHALQEIGIQYAMAVASVFELEVIATGRLRRQRFCQGRPVGAEEVRETAEPDRTMFTFRSDPEIFTTNPTFDDRLPRRLEEYAFLVPVLTIHLLDHRQQAPTETVLRSDGILDYLRLRNRERDPVHPTPFFVEADDGTADGTRLQLALQWTSHPDPCLRYFANTHPYEPRTASLDGLLPPLHRVLMAYAGAFGAGRDHGIRWQDLESGLTVVLSVFLQDPKYYGATRSWLADRRVPTLVRRAVRSTLPLYLECYEDNTVAIVRHLLAVSQARQARKQGRKQARDRG